MLPLMWIAGLRSCASSSSARASAGWPPATSRVPSCTRDQRPARYSRTGPAGHAPTCTPLRRHGDCFAVALGAATPASRGARLRGRCKAVIISTAVHRLCVTSLGAPRGCPVLSAMLRETPGLRLA